MADHNKTYNPRTKLQYKQEQHQRKYTFFFVTIGVRFWMYDSGVDTVCGLLLLQVNSHNSFGASKAVRCVYKSINSRSAQRSRWWIF